MIKHRSDVKIGDLIIAWLTISKALGVIAWNRIDALELQQKSTKTTILVLNDLGTIDSDATFIITDRGVVLLDSDEYDVLCAFV